MTRRLEIRNLTKVYPDGRVALDDVCLTLSPGVLGLLGPNGAGKTTLIETLALTREPEGGRVTFGALDARRSHRAWRRLLGLVPQHFGFLPHLSGRETLRMMAALSGLSGRLVRARIEALLERVRLAWAGDRRVEAYSRGMRQRLGIAASLVAEPDLWLLDEPTSGLDPEERVAFRELLAEEGGKRVTVLSTHIVEDVERGCGEVAVLREGRIDFQGTPSTLTARARGRVWTWRMPGRSDEVDRWASDPRVVSIRATGDTAEVRAVAPTAPTPEARASTPTLEDAYLNLLGGFREEARRFEPPPEGGAPNR